MKIDRLYAITLYLLSHGKTTAQKLAERFEVSVRTIRRDVDALGQAGIPVTAYPGASGGYDLAEGWRMDGQLGGREDYGRILTALKGLASVTGDCEIRSTMDKVAALPGASDSSDILLDFSALRERDEATLSFLRSAIPQERAVAFDYTNANGEHRRHTVEPVALLYRWYAWYLLAYSRRREDYRTYKLARMENAALTDEPLTRRHASAEAILRELDGQDHRTYLEIEARCSPNARAAVSEYLSGIVEEEYANGDARMRLRVVENERLWMGMLLSLGGAAEVLSPERVRARLLALARKISAMYDQP